MSKYRKQKKTKKKLVTPSKNKLEATFQFCALIFLISLGGFFGVWLFGDYLFNLFEIEIEVVTYGYIIFTGTSSALCFGIATLIKNNVEKEKNFLFDWIIGMFLFSMFAIFLLAIYQF